MLINFCFSTFCLKISSKYKVHINTGIEVSSITSFMILYSLFKEIFVLLHIILNVLLLQVDIVFVFFSVFYFNNFIVCHKAQVCHERLKFQSPSLMCFILVYAGNPKNIIGLLLVGVGT